MPTGDCGRSPSNAAINMPDNDGPLISEENR